MTNDNLTTLITITTFRNTSFCPQPVEPSTVLLTIKHLQETKCFGSDDIPVRFKKDSLCVIIYYLTIILNTSIVTGVFPVSWKHALVVPVHKGGDTSDCSNYRPISLLYPLHIYKFFLRVLTDRQLVVNRKHP